MVRSLNIEVERVARSRIGQVDFVNIPFGRTFADHMFIAEYRHGEWTNLRIVPYANMTISPASPAIHYGQAIFEGLKAFHGSDNETRVFRPHDNWKRLNISADRLGLVNVPEKIFMEGIAALIDLDRAWIPTTPAGSLYIRPFLFSADEYIGIRPSRDFNFMIINSPTGTYYSAPLKVKIETHYTRAVEGGMGFAKASGNYAAAIYPSALAAAQGYHQLIWTDGKKHEYIEESGTMNVMFVMGDTLITPALSDSILAGITRDSVLTIAREWGIKVEERKISVKELIDGLLEGKLKEAFGVGTAATIAPIETIGYEGADYPLPPVDESGFVARVYAELEGIKRGTRQDLFGWTVTM